MNKYFQIIKMSLQSFLTKPVNACLLAVVLSLILINFTANAQVQNVRFRNPGSFTWTAPCGVTSVTVEAWGGGGAGGGATTNGRSGGGGAGGAYASSTFTVVPGTTYNLNVAQGGQGDIANGVLGADSWFGSSVTIIAKGGVGGIANGSNTTNAAGGTGTITGSIGDQVFRGGNGYLGDDSRGGAGGGGAGSIENGGDASSSNTGVGGLQNGGDGGQRSGTNNSTGNNANDYGGGGGGAHRTSSDRRGGDGGDGAIIISYRDYCAVNFNNTVEPITLVQFAGIDNATSNTIDGTPELEKFCTPLASVNIGSTYTITVKGNTNDWRGNQYTSHFRVFIDWNQNGLFTDAGESIYIGTITSSTGLDSKTASINIIVPVGAVLGTTKMRVLKNYNTDPTNSCGTYNDGQGEEYSVVVSGNCQQPTGANANGTITSLTVCSGTSITLKQTGGLLGPGQQWKWYSGSCAGALINTNTNADAAYTFTPTAGTSTYYVRAEGGTCGTTGLCKSVIVIVKTAGTISVASGNKDFSVCRNVNNTSMVSFTIGGDATTAVATGLPTGVTGTLLGTTFTLSGTPTAAAGSYPYTITLGGNSPCANQEIAGVITITQAPVSVVYTTNVVYCANSTITPNNPVVTGGVPTSYSAILPAGLTIDPLTGIVSGTATTVSAATNYSITATNDCGTYVATLNITISNGNTVYNITPNATQNVCSNWGGTIIGLSNSQTGINYQLFRNGSAVGALVAGTTGAAISFGNQTIAGTYTIVAVTGCATNMNGSTIINITAQPTATFTYPTYTFCNSGTSAAATITGLPVTGTFSASPIGLVFADVNTGSIDLSNSNSGTYTISYTIAAAGGCGIYTTTKSISIGNSANYYTVTGGGGYCTGGSGLPVGLDGSQNGITYQLYRGATLVSTLTGTGSALSFGNQTIAGTYTIKAIMGSCEVWMDEQAVISVNAVPSAIAVTPATATLCQGTVIPLTATFSPASTTAANVTVASGNANIAIPDNNVSGASSLLRVTGIPVGATITGVSINFNIAHNNVGDLVINLKGPNGSVLNIANRIGGTGNNFTNTIVNSSAVTSITTATVPYTGTFAPQAAGTVSGATSVSGNISNSNYFSGLYGATAASANGNWILSVRDNVNNTSGTFSNWQIVVSYTTINNPTMVSWSSVTDLYSNPGATIPYIAGTSLATVYAKPSVSGNITYTATASNAFGCNTSTTTTLTVNASPNLIVSPDYCSYPGVVRITATSNIPITTWLWSTGVTGTTTATTSYIDVNAAGTFYVTAQATGNSCPGSGVMSIAQELVTNGDFELGNTGFISDYNYKADLPGVNNELVPDGGADGYGVGVNGQNYHSGFWGVDHTYGTGTGNFMLVNGHGSLVVWKNENVTVLPNTTYYFSAWGISLNNAGPFAQLRFQINGTNVGTTATLPAGVNSNANNGWTKFYGTWNSGSNTSANINIIDLETAAGGNDFGLDDISFGTLSGFFSIVSDPASNTQNSVCEGTPITDISFEVGGDGNSPILSAGSLPAGLTTYWNGRTFRISGTPASAGTYNFSYSTTGCNIRIQNISITVLPALKAGTFSGGSVVSSCYNSNGTLSLTGTVGTLVWEKSTSNNGPWTTVANSNYSNLTSAIYYRAIAQNTAGCKKDTSAIIKIAPRNLWTGRTNADWNLATNWADDNLPNIVECDDVYIPNVTPAKPQPVISNGTVVIEDLDLLAGSSLTINNNAILQIAGSITSPAGAINASKGSIELNGTTGAQTISGSWFAGRNLNALIISNDVNVSATANDTLNILEYLDFNSTTADLNTYDNISLKSTALKTASVGELAVGNVISGKVTVERYISENRRWRFLSAPTNGQNFKQSWQEGAATANANPKPGYGFVLGYPNSGAYLGLGFDLYAPGGHTVKTYNPVTNGWDGISSTSELLSGQKGYMTFVIGNRSGTAGTNTVARTTGTLYQGTQPTIAVPANTFVAIGNPFASPVQLSKISKTNVQDVFYVWDPKLTTAGASAYGLGAYQTITKNLETNIYEVFPGGGSYGAQLSQVTSLQSGLAFFVRGNASNGTLYFEESDKGTGSAQVFFTAGAQQRLRANLGVVQADTTTVVDGVMVQYNSQYGNEVNNEDVLKVGNTNENISIQNAGKTLIIENRNQVMNNDTIHLKMSGVRVQTYQWQLVLDNMDAPGQTAFLIDRYLNTSTALNMAGTTSVNFQIVNIAGSYASDRFKIVFNKAVVLPVNITNIAANRNNDKTVTVQWKVENELNLIGYEVERSSDGIHFYSFLTQSPNSNSGGSASYQVLDRSVVEGNLFYRIKANSISGQVQYSAIVKVAALKTVVEKSIQVYPNIVEHKTIHVKFQNQTNGLYKVQLMANSGAMVYQTSVEVNNTNQVKMLQLNSNIAGGNYKLVITGDDGNKTVQSIILL